MKKLWCRGKGDFCEKEKTSDGHVNCIGCDHIDGTGVEYREFEEATKTDAKTNGDLIRAMSDAELATFINSIYYSCTRCSHDCPGVWCDTDECEKWLQLPVEGVQTV